MWRGAAHARERVLARFSAAGTSVSEVETAQLLLGFELPDGGFREVAILRRPVGLRFQPGIAPIVITDIDAGSAGEDVGIQKGWVLTLVAGENVKAASFERTLELLSQYAAPLPDPAKAVQVALGRGDMKEALRLAGLPWWVVPLGELVILVLEVLLVVFLARQLPSEWLAALLGPLRDLLLPTPAP